MRCCFRSWPNCTKMGRFTFISGQANVLKPGGTRKISAWSSMKKNSIVSKFFPTRPVYFSLRNTLHLLSYILWTFVYELLRLIYEQKPFGSVYCSNLFTTVPRYTSIEKIILTRRLRSPFENVMKIFQWCNWKTTYKWNDVAVNIVLHRIEIMKPAEAIEILWDRQCGRTNRIFGSIRF